MQQTEGAQRSAQESWVAEILVNDQPVDRWEVPGATTRGLAVSYVTRGLRSRLAESSGAVEAVDGGLAFVGDGAPLVLTGRVQRGSYATGEWVPAGEESTATVDVAGKVVWGG